MSAVMVDSFRGQQMQIPHRKPVHAQPAPSAPSPTIIQTHSRSHSGASSTAYSASGHTGYPQGPYADRAGQSLIANSYIQPARRTLSNATTSTNSTSGSGSNRGAATINAPSLHRSSSNRSGGSYATSNSYVALMRKQKATVWCDRAQLEDPRLVAQRRAAKQRAAAEMVGGVHSVRLLSNAAGMRSKIRHHGVQKAALYQPGNLSGNGVPMRLSASEVDEGDSDDGETGSQTTGSNSRTNTNTTAPHHHHRTGSGRSSIGSGRQLMYNPVQSRLSNASTPPYEHTHSTSVDSGRSEFVDETPVPADFATSKSGEYFPSRSGAHSTGSTSSGERETSFGAPGQMPQRASVEEDRFSSDELRRRGSVDDRTMTMNAVRLFVANPDVDD